MLLPIHYTAPESSAQFSRTEFRLLVVSGGLAQVLDMPPADSPPIWLADLADYAASRSRFSQAPVPDRAIIEKLRTDMLASSALDSWSRFGKWYFLPTPSRAVSPWSTVTMDKYISQLLTLKTRESLEYAKRIAFNQPEWMLKIASAQKALQP